MTWYKFTIICVYVIPSAKYFLCVVLCLQLGNSIHGTVSTIVLNTVGHYMHINPHQFYTM